MSTDLPFIKKELEVIVLNPTNLPTTDYHKLSILQGSLKTLSETNRTKLCKSILENGYFIPAFIWRSGEDMYILDATQRYHALEELERKGYTIPGIPYVEIEAKDKKDAARKLLQITSRYGEINPETTFFTDFDIEIDYLDEISIPELDLAFEDLDSKAIEEDEVPEVPEEAITRVGDLWLCGKHRVLCGDCTKAEDVGRLMQGKKAVLMATDPPYGDSWVQKAKDMNAHGYGHSHAVLHGTIQSDDLSQRELKSFLDVFLKCAKLAGDAPMPIYVWHGAKRMVFEQALLDAGYLVHQPVVWVKKSFVIGRLHYHPRCEWALHGWLTGNGKCPFYGKPNQSDVWEVGRENDKIHPTQKPVELFTIPILNHTKQDEIVYDPFLGSGTQIMAADQLNRICYGIEIEPQYVDVILERYHNLTGIDPIREDCKKWSEIKSI
jgi:DNA modification methylase